MAASHQNAWSPSFRQVRAAAFDELAHEFYDLVTEFNGAQQLDKKVEILSRARHLVQAYRELVANR